MGDETVEQKIITAVMVPVKNLCKKYAAINLRVEICVVDGVYTYHFDLDRQDFLMIQTKGSPNTADERKYIGYKVAEYTRLRTCKKTTKELIDLLDKEGVFLRVRIHACHEFTGFGRIFEEKFFYKNKTQFHRLSAKGVC